MITTICCLRSASAAAAACPWKLTWSRCRTTALEAARSSKNSALSRHASTASKSATAAVQQESPTNRPESPSSADNAATANLDPYPALFIKKYECVVDSLDIAGMAKASRPESVAAATKDEDHPLEKSSQQLTPETLLQRRIKLIRAAVRHSSTYEALMRAFREKPEPLLSSVDLSRSRLPSPPALSAARGDEEARPLLRAVEPVKLQSVLDEPINWSDTSLDLRRLPRHYLSLAKSNLTLLVCLTSAAGFGLAPADPVNWAMLGVSTAGVALISAAANTVNQVLEVPFDSQMNRTKNRVLVRGHLSTLHAAAFAAATASAGTFVLLNYVNATAAALGALNLVLYTSVYTPMKRAHVANTWVGSVVGAIPPLIGWAAASDGSLPPAAFVLAALLFAWQFPHFNSLSWNLRPDYSRAGYRMLSVTDPDMCRRVALRYAVACVAVCSVAAPGLGLTEPGFALDSLPVNAYLVLLAWRFHQRADSESSRKLFRFTLVHLPLIMMLMFLDKKKAPTDEEKSKAKAEEAVSPNALLLHSERQIQA